MCECVTFHISTHPITYSDSAAQALKQKKNLVHLCSCRHCGEIQLQISQQKHLNHSYFPLIFLWRVVSWQSASILL